MKKIKIKQMKLAKLIVGIAAIGILITSCKKENKSVESTIPLSYTSLSAAQDTIAIGASTNITTIATGDELTYIWSATDGDIIGSGSQITYGASPCCGGNNTVTCTVKDANNNQESKSVSILVQ